MLVPVTDTRNPGTTPLPMQMVAQLSPPEEYGEDEIGHGQQVLPQLGLLPGDVSLIAAARERDPAGFAGRVRELSAPGQDIVARLLGDNPEAEVARAVGAQGPRVYLEARRAVRQLADHFSGIAVPSAAAELLGGALRADEAVVERHMAGLPSQQRDAIALFLRGATHADIERNLKIGPDRVTATLRAGFRTLVRALADEFADTSPGEQAIAQLLPDDPGTARRRGLLTELQDACLTGRQQRSSITGIAAATARSRIEVTVALLDAVHYLTAADDDAIWRTLCVELGLPEPAEDLGNFVRTLRESRGWTRQQLADRSRLDRATVHRVELNLRRDGSDLKTWRKLCVAFELSDQAQDLSLRKFFAGRLDSFSLDVDRHRTLGSFVIACRIAKGWAQTQLAQAAGIDVRTVEKIELNKYEHGPRRRTLHALCTALDISEADRQRWESVHSEPDDAVVDADSDDAVVDEAWGEDRIAAEQARAVLALADVLVPPPEDRETFSGGPGEASHAAAPQSPEESALVGWFHRRTRVGGTVQGLSQYLELHRLSRDQARRWLVRAGVAPAKVEAALEESGVALPSPAAFGPDNQDSPDRLAAPQRSWLHAVRGYLVVEATGMDALLDAPAGTWAGVENGEAALTSRELRALLRRVVPLEQRPGYYSSAAPLFPDLNLMTAEDVPSFPEGYGAFHKYLKHLVRRSGLAAEDDCAPPRGVIEGDVDGHERPPPDPSPRVTGGAALSRGTAPWCSHARRGRGMLSRLASHSAGIPVTVRRGVDAGVSPVPIAAQRVPAS